MELSATEARATLPAILDRVSGGEEVVITRHGRAVAVVVHPSALRVRRTDAASVDVERLKEALELARSTPLAERPSLLETRAEELLADVRAGRTGR